MIVFWMWVRKVSRKAKVFVSEYSAPEDFECIWEKQITNAMSTKNTYKPTERHYLYLKEYEYECVSKSNIVHVYT